MTKGPTMDIDALKAAMAALDDRDGEIVLPGTAAARQARRSLAALATWQIVQTGAGIVIALAGGRVWSNLLPQPGLLLASGLLVNLYGMAMIALGIAGFVHAAQIDMAAPVAETETHMALLHRIKLVSGWMLGASWWILWLPFATVIAWTLWGIDVLAPVGAGTWVAVTLASGAIGWAGMALLRRWAVRSGRLHLAARIDEAMVGRGFQEARRRINEVARFAAG